MRVCALYFAVQRRLQRVRVRVRGERLGLRAGLGLWFVLGILQFRDPSDFGVRIDMAVIYEAEEGRRFGALKTLKIFF